MENNKSNSSVQEELLKEFVELSEILTNITLQLPATQKKELEELSMYKEYNYLKQTLDKIPTEQISKDNKKVHPIVDMLFDISLNNKREEIKSRIIEELKEVHNNQP